MSNRKAAVHAISHLQPINARVFDSYARASTATLLVTCASSNSARRLILKTGLPYSFSTSKPRHSVNVEVPTSRRLPVAVFSVQYWSLLARRAE